MNNNTNIALQETLNDELERMELQFGHRLGQAALFGLIALPLIPGLLTMISIGVNFPELLHIPAPVAWVLGFAAMIGIEVLGLFSIRLALKMRKFNHKASGRDVEKAPIGQGYAAAGAYVATVMICTVLLKVYPEFAVWSLIPLGLMGALADWVFALNGDHNERESALRKLIVDEQQATEQADETEQLRTQLNERDQMITQLNTTVQDLVNNVQSLHAAHANMIDLMNAAHANTEQVTAGILANMNTMQEALTQEVKGLSRLMNSANVQPAMNAQVVNNHPAQAVHGAVDSVQPESAQPEHVQPDSVQFVDKMARQSALIRYIAENLNGETSDRLNKSELGKALGVSRVTVGRDIEELIAASRLSVNGHVNVLA